MCESCCKCRGSFGCSVRLFFGSSDFLFAVSWLALRAFVNSPVLFGGSRTPVLFGELAWQRS